MCVEPLRKGCLHHQRTPWACAVVLILLLTACFIASCLVTHRNFLRCWSGPNALSLPAYRGRLTCIRDVSGWKGAPWHCCPAGWRPFRASCYTPFRDNRTWAESERNCSGMGAHLAGVPSGAEQSFIAELLDPRFSYYLGLSRGHVDTEWHWVDQIPFHPRMTFWHENNPSSIENGNCVVLAYNQNTWGWSNLPCDVETSRICQISRTILP